MKTPDLYNLLRAASLSPATKLSGGEVLWEVNLAFPGLARALYARNNPRNRRIGANNAEKIRRALEEEKWMFDGNPVRVNVNDVLDDGQHRSREVDAADLPDGAVLRTLVLTEMAPEAMLLYDINRPRSHGNALEMAGVNNSDKAAAVTRLLTAYADEAWPASLHGGSVTNEEAVATYFRLNAGGLLDHAVVIGARCYEINRTVATARVFGAAYYTLAGLHRARADQFFAQLTQEEAQQPQIAKLVSTLSARYAPPGENVQSRKAKGTDDESVMSLALVFKTWNDWVTGYKGRKQLKWAAKVESFPVPVSPLD
jgi:hypothetical protein